MRTRAGFTLALAAAVISGFAVFTNSYGVKAFGDATVYTTAKNLVAAIVLGALLLAVPRREGFSSPRNLAQWTGLGAVAVIGGSVPFILFFKGLAETSAVDAGFILLVPGAIITALLQAGVQGTAFPQWPGTPLVLAGAAVVGLAAIRKPRTALVEVR